MLQTDIQSQFQTDGSQKLDELLLIPAFGKTLSEREKSRLRQSEIQWHYSQHYLAEMRGEEVIEDMLQRSTDKRQRSILNSQLLDEKHHAQLFAQKIKKIGLESRACGYADGYAKMVMSLNTFSEKVFAFQILTEAISSAYCEWRLNHIRDSYLNEVDTEVGQDERRHLVMGKTLLNMCDPDELKEILTPERQSELIKEMNTLCEQSVRKDMFHSLAGDFLASNREALERPTTLDRHVFKTVIREFKDLKQKFIKKPILE